MNKHKRLIPILFSFLAVLTCAAVLGGCGEKNTDNTESEDTNITQSENLSIYYFNAGKADACVISDGENNIMIDTGESFLADEILSYFDDNNITDLDYLIITHFDKDHVGSASSVIDNIEIENVLQSNVPKDSEFYDSYLTALDKNNITPVTVSGDYEFTLGDLNFKVNGPEVTYEDNASNNSSLITSLVYGATSFIFMGDAQNDRLKDFISINTSEYDFVKIPYHGNYQKKLDNLLENINPKYAVVTSSEEEPEEDKMIELLNEMGIKYYLTREGAVTVYSDKTNITIEQ